MSTATLSTMLAVLLLFAALANLALASAAITLNAFQSLRSGQRRTAKRGDEPSRSALPDLSSAPFISVHVAAHNEPPEMVIATLDALAAMAYPRFEVLVVDNNTVDATKWRPVKAHVERLGRRFQFIHRMGVAGAKAGALNIALECSDVDAQYVAIVDADYQVSPEFLPAAVGAMRADIQFVQFPQAYLNGDQAHIVVDELSDYFRTFPTAANRSGASLLTGTLSVISIDALRSVGGWPVGSITEDAQLGVLLWRAGARGLYIDREVGRGLLPLDLEGLRLQRGRWVTGNVQTLLSALTDWRQLRSRKGKVAVAAQLTAWVGFLALPLLSLAALVGLQAMAPATYAADSGLWIGSQRVAALTIIVALGGLVMRALANDSPATLTVMLALIWTSSFSWLSVLIGRRQRFRRTPKGAEAKITLIRFEEAAALLSLGLATHFAISGDPLTAIALALAASGLVAGPIVDNCLRRAARQQVVLSTCKA